MCSILLELVYIPYLEELVHMISLFSFTQITVYQYGIFPLFVLLHVIFKTKCVTF